MLTIICSGSEEKTPIEVCIQSTASLLYKFTERIPECVGGCSTFCSPLLRKTLLFDLAVRILTGLPCSPQTMITVFLCNTPLGPLEHIPGSNARAFLLTKVRMLPVRVLIKRFPNPRCLARHSYRIWNEGSILPANTCIYIMHATDLACHKGQVQVK